jgi:DNA primase
MNLPTHIKQFFADRKINEQTLKEFNVGWTGTHIRYPVTNFSIFRRDPATSTGMKYLYQKGSKATLYGADKIKNEKVVWITEGMNDCLACWSAGIPAVSSTGGAMTFKLEWLEYLNGKEVIICLDSDEAGGKGMAKIYNVIPTAGLIFLPDGYKDICDLTSAGKELALLKPVYFNSLKEILEDQMAREARFQTAFFHRAYIKTHSEPVHTKHEHRPVVGDKLTRAKAFPIDSMLKFNHSGSTTCLWHSESEPSLHLYKDQNKCWCFGGCGRGYDAIDVYQKLHNCSFIEAVEALQ